MGSAWKSRMEKTRLWLRQRRKLLYVAGACLLFAGISLDLVSAFLDEDLLAVSGITLPIVGSVLLLLNYLAAMERTGVVNNKDAVDEAIFGTMFYLYLGLCVLTLFLYIPQVLEELEDKRDRIILITPLVKPIAEVSGVSLMMYFLFIATMIVLAFNALTKNGLVTYLKIFRGQPVSKDCADKDPYFGNPISTVLMSFFALLFFSIVYYAFVIASGIDPEIPDFGTGVWYHVYIFSEASVWEEIISRTLLIGVPLLFIDLLLRRKSSLKPWEYLVGGKMKIGMVEAGVALFSAIMFGLAHVGGWDAYKFLPAMISGLFMAYLFLRFGLYAAIMLHFTIDFFDIPLEAMQVSSDVGFPLVLLLLGLISFYKYAKESLKFVYYDLMQFPRPAPTPVRVAPAAAPLGMDEAHARARIHSKYAGKKSYYAYGVTIIFVLLSSGLMLWIMIDITLNPDYYGGINTAEDVAGWFSVFIPNAAALVVTAFAWKRGDVRTYMLAATLSAFSFTGVLALISEWLLWRAYKKHGAPWKRDKSEPG